jgi:quinol-cytochrome oxidoreductase complex cytochrome b subunit
VHIEPVLELIFLFFIFIGKWQRSIHLQFFLILVFLVQVAMGFAMTFYYRPTVTEAVASVQ